MDEQPEGEFGYLQSDELPYLSKMASFNSTDEQERTQTWQDTEKAAFCVLAAAVSEYLDLYENSASGQMNSTTLASYMQVHQARHDHVRQLSRFLFSAQIRNTWYSTMQTYRTAGLAGNDGTGTAPIPYAQYLDLYRSGYTDALPSESFVRLQQNASWAFGYTFVTAYVYNDATGFGVIPRCSIEPGTARPTPCSTTLPRRIARAATSAPRWCGW